MGRHLAILATLFVVGTTSAEACTRPANAGAMVGEVTQRAMMLRRNSGRSDLSSSRRLARAAQDHACWMARNGRMAHRGQSGSTVGDRAKRAGYQWGFIAENIAKGRWGAAGVSRAWANSRGHRRNLLSNRASQIGIGVAQRDGELYWAMVLGAPRR